ncbi:MAG TPA: hypothetical protein ENL20_07315 [Candidatus Cloacimonetes bacterium]|nr:hypothetical protein [Candidatus Cloacimonadota bacterium]
MKKQTVYMIAGANGTGKTTFAKEFIKDKNITFLNADEIEKQFNPDDREGGKIRAGKEFFQRLKQLMSNNNDFVIESTLSGKSLISFLKKLKRKEVRIILLYIFLENVELAIDRVRIRVEEGGHNIPTQDIIRRYSRSINNFWNIYRDLVEEWQIFYNGEENIIQAAFGFNDEYKIIDEDKFELFLRSLNVED